MGILKGLIFDGIDSKDFGIGITGEGVYNAPTRDVEMIKIPGRNGDFALDNGRFNNIELKYPAGAFGDDQSDFADKISDLRNALCSRIGYKILRDEYHPNEFRKAIYKSGLEVSPVHYSTAGEFEIIFECTPQRFLDSGETEQTVTSGGTITNPTMFESQPLLLVEGYGRIVINGQEITIDSTSIGHVIIAGSWNSPQGQAATFAPNLSALASNDSFYVDVPTLKMWLYGGSIAPDNNLSVSSSDTDWNAFATWGNVQGRDAIYIEANASEFTFVKNTDHTYTTTLTVTTDLLNISVILSVDYSGGIITFGVSTNESYLMQASFRGIEGDSTKSALGSPIYIDCEIGEAYIIDDDEVVSVNNAVVLPADLPTLKPGSNAVNYNLSVSELKIVPRWWIV